MPRGRCCRRWARSREGEGEEAGTGWDGGLVGVGVGLLEVNGIARRLTRAFSKKI